MGQQGGITGGGVVFFVWFEDVTVSIFAESLAHQPVRSLYQFTVMLVVRLVAQADEALPVGEPCGEPELLFLGAEDVEALEMDVSHIEYVAVAEFVEEDGGAYLRGQFLGKEVGHHALEDAQHLLVAIDVDYPVAFPFRLLLQKEADDPQHTYDMVGVGMGDKDVMDEGNGDVRIFQLPQDAVAAAGVDEEGCLIVVKEKARVVATCHKGVACAEDGDLRFHDAKITCFFVVKGVFYGKCCIFVTHYL